MKEFFTTLQGKAIAVLTIIALLFGIATEGVVMYRNAMEGVTAQSIANESRLRQEAERRVQQALAEKTIAEQRTAEAVANESRLRQEAERQVQQALAEKTAAEQRTAEAVAAVSREMQAATVAEKEASARKLDGEAEIAQMKACAVNVSKCTPEQKCLIEGYNDVGSRYSELSTAAVERLAGPSYPIHLSRSRECAHLRVETPANAPQLPPRCRQNYADWQGYTSHGAFAVYGPGGCIWNGNNVYRGSTAQAVAALRADCNKQNLACTIIATK